MNLFQLASAIQNDVIAFMGDLNSAPNINIEQLMQDIIEERLLILQELHIKGMIPKKDLVMAINCIPIDCEKMSKCPSCFDLEYGDDVKHFEIPQLFNGINSISFIGSVDKRKTFKAYDSFAHNFHKHSWVKNTKPYVYIDTTPNENNMYDGYIFNAPYIKTLSISAIFKDPRQLAIYTCCSSDEIDNLSFLANDIKRRLTEKKLRYHQASMIPHPDATKVSK